MEIFSHLCLIFFRMTLELCLFGVGVEATIPNELAAFHEIWLAEALRTVWFIWSNLGWNENAENVIRKDDWTRLELSEEIVKILSRIDHILRVAKAPNFDVVGSFGPGWSHLVMTVKMLVRERIFLEPCEQVEAFRSLVTDFLVHGVRMGLDKFDPAFPEFFLFSVRDNFENIFQELLELEVSLDRSETETTVTVISPMHNTDVLKCNCTIICTK